MVGTSDTRVDLSGLRAEIVARENPTECPKCKGSNLSQETDVLDTWFSSALWPFSTMGWPDQTNLLKTFYPTSCLVTGFDILFFWVARMMMMGLKFMGDVPFKDVYIHALVRDELGKKMSKSLGNVIDPLEVMDKFGTDAFRFTLAALAAQGRDIRLSESRIEGYRNFMNKIWNAARFALPYVESLPADAIPDKSTNLPLADRWILSRLNRTVQEVRRSIETYCFNDAAQALYHFTWHEFCDWYIEESKIPLNSGDPARASTTAATLNHVLNSILQLLHPFIPFITEEIASKLNPERSTIIRGPFPTFDEERIDAEAERQMNVIMGVITSVRNIRSEMNVPPSKILPAAALPSCEEERELVESNLPVIRALARVGNRDWQTWGKHGAAPHVCNGSSGRNANIRAS